MKHRIAVFAEDNVVWGPIVVSYLSNLGFSVLWARNGEEALVLVEAENPDIVILDIDMPVMDGFAALQSIRANQSWGDLPVMICSEDIGHGRQEKAIELGANACLKKPRTVTEFKHEFGAVVIRLCEA